jgi:hypothetical protein
MLLLLLLLLLLWLLLLAHFKSVCAQLLRRCLATFATNLNENATVCSSALVPAGLDLHPVVTPPWLTRCVDPTAAVGIIRHLVQLARLVLRRLLLSRLRLSWCARRSVAGYQ